MNDALPPTVSKSEGRRGVLLWISAAFLLGAALSAPTLSGGFLADDYWYLDQSQTITFSEHPLLALRKGNFYYFRPLTSFLWSILYHLFSDQPVWYRGTSLLFHLAASAAFFFLARRMVKNDQAAGLAGLAFSLHPLHHEAVAWISANSDLLATLFFILALERYLSWEEKKDLRKGRPAIVGFLFWGTLALLSKESAYVLPAVVLCAYFLPGLRRTRGERLKVLALIGLLTVGIVTLKVILGLGQLRPATGVTSLSAIPGNVGMSLIRFLAPTAWSRWAQALNLLHFLLLLALLGLSLAVSRGDRRRLFFRGLGFGGLFLLLSLLPPATTSRLGPHLEFSRTLYLPSAAFCLLLAALFSALVGDPSADSPYSFSGNPSPRREKLLRFLAFLRPTLAVLLPAVFFWAGRANLRPWVEAGEASRGLEYLVRSQGQPFQPGQSALVEGVPVVYKGVPFHSNSYTLSVAFSLARFNDLFKKRGYAERNDLPFYAVSAEVPKIEARMTPGKRLRELIQSPESAFDYRIRWESRWSVKKEAGGPPENVAE